MLTANALELGCSETELDDYLKVAQKLGLPTNAGVLKAALGKLGIMVYNREDVNKCMDAQFGDDWAWLALREADIAGWAIQSAHKYSVRCHEHSPNLAEKTASCGHNSLVKTVYPLEIPLPVLYTVQRVLEVVPDARFFVSGEWEHGKDPASADPFLMVTSPHTQAEFIIEVWDEPSFRR